MLCLKSLLLQSKPNEMTLEELKKTLSQASQVFILTDENVAMFWLPETKRWLGCNHAVEIVLKPGEKYKTMPTAQRIWKTLMKHHADRQAGVVVSKKSFHDAVDRNRAKRLLREAYRLLVKEGVMPEKTEWIFIGRAALKGRKCQDVMEEMARLASRVS